MTDLGGGGSVGNAINNAGQITGVFDVAGSFFGHAFLYKDGVLIDLGTLPGKNGSGGTAINNAGQIVGSSGGSPFLYSNGAMTDLNSLIDPTLQLTLMEATGINDLGQIVANSYDRGGRAYLLTPVPEPGTWLLFGAGLLLVAALARSYTR